MKVDVEQRGHVLLIGINRPEKRNAFDLELIDQFGAAYERLGTDPSCGSAWCTRSVTISAPVWIWQKSGRRSPRSDRGAGR